MFIGREKEITRLQDLFQKKAPSLVVCKGRRRIGKSTLVSARFSYMRESWTVL